MITYYKKFMKHLKIYEAFTDSDFSDLRQHAKLMQERYTTEEIGLIRAWGTTLYLAYHDLLSGGDLVPYPLYLETLAEYALLDEESEEYEEMTDWICDEPPTIDRVPLWNKSRLQKDFAVIANKTPTDMEITLYRTSDKEEPGLNSYTLRHGWYGDIKNQREYMLPKGTPVIWGHGIADNDEIIWSPTLDDLKRYIVNK